MSYQIKVVLLQQNVNNKNMCTYNISINDMLAQQARSAFIDDNALKDWMQKQLEIALNLLLERKAMANNDAPRVKHSHDDLMGILSKAPQKDYKRMHLSEKYGV